jgi:DNA-binding IclR family transcriptional regulator
MLLRQVATAGNPGVRLVDLAKRSELHNATAHRLLRAMTAEGLLSYDAVQKRYYTGPEIFRFAQTGFGPALSRIFHPALERIAKRTGLAAYLSVREGTEIVCVDRVVGQSLVQVVPYTIGSRRPLGVGAAGLAVLAALGDDEVALVLDKHEREKAHQALPKHRTLKLISEGRRNGFVYNPALFIKGVGGLGLAALHAEGGMASVSVVGLEVQFSNQAERKKIADIIAQELIAVDAGSMLIPSVKKTS